jgi:hypothetical protein
VGAAVGAERLLARPLGEPLAVASVLVLIGAAVAAGPSRRLLARSLRLAHLRRAWERAATDAGLSAGPLRTGRVLRTSRVPAGDELHVRVRRGQAVADLDARRDVLAACLRVREVRVLREPADATTARVTLVRRDPFEGGEPLRWPCSDAAELSLWDPVPIGVDERGEPAEIGLVERNVLIGGEPGAGKSVAISALVAAAALDRGSRVWLLDGKLVELAVWAPVAERIIGPDGEEAFGAEWRDVDLERRMLMLRRGFAKGRLKEYGKTAARAGRSRCGPGSRASSTAAASYSQHRRGDASTSTTGGSAAGRPRSPRPASSTGESTTCGTRTRPEACPPAWTSSRWHGAWARA